MKMRNLLPKNSVLRPLLILLVLVICASASRAQVKGISYTLSPTGDYVFWNENTGISDGLLLGGQLGFGFGEFVELRASYLQSVNAFQRNFGALNTPQLQNLTLDTINVGVQRWGGDLKINLARGAVVPYLTVGTGVQTLSPDSMSSYKNIYVSAGGGLQFSLGDRVSLGVQAVNTSFNDSPVRGLTTEAERIANGVSLEDYPNDLLNNWSLRASLILYLGGRRPGELTEVDKAYRANFSSGISLPIEITGGQLNFSSNLPFASTKFIGVSSGFNFGPYVGIRGFYWRGMEAGYFSTVDRLALYGGEGKFKLANGQGLTPSINGGGGVIDALDGYMVRGRRVDVDNKPFVSGGVGLDFPFSRSLKLSAYGKALLTSNDLLENATNPDELSTSWAYGLSLNLVLGNSARPVSEIRQNAYDEKVMDNLEAERQRSADLLDSYEERINTLNKEISEAQNNDNTTRANTLKNERALVQNARDQLSELRSREKKANREAFEEEDAMLVTLKPSEYGSLIDNIDRSYKNSLLQVEQIRKASNENFSELDQRLQSINEKLDEIQTNNQDLRLSQEKMFDELKSTRDSSAGVIREYTSEIRKLEDQIQKALASDNRGEAATRSNERQAIERRLEAIQKAQAREAQANQAAVQANDPALLNMTPEEFRTLLAETRASNEKSQKQLEQSMNQFQRNALGEINKLQRSNQEMQREYSRQLQNEMESLREEIRQLRQSGTFVAGGTTGSVRENSRERRSNTIDVLPRDGEGNINYLSEEQRAYQNPNRANEGFFSLLNYNGMSVFGGFNVGGTPTINLGLRSHYRYKDTDFILMPETFLGLGTHSTYGITVNALYELNIEKAEGFNPYVGVGAGVMRIGPSGEESVRLGTNIILGANLFKVANGRFYVDFTGRNLFRYNQLAAGIRLPF